MSLIKSFILDRHINLGPRRLPKSVPSGAIHTRRYAKKVPGHHIQVDVKFVSLRNFEGSRVRRFLFTAIEDATRIRAMKIYPRHNQVNAIEFIDYKVERSLRTDQEEFYQLLTYTDDVDLNEKLAKWERSYNMDRPHGAFKGKTPYKAMRSMLE